MHKMYKHLIHLLDRPSYKGYRYLDIIEIFLETNNDLVQNVNKIFFGQ